MSDSPRSPAAAHDEDVQEHASVEEQEEMMHRQAMMEVAAMAPDLHKLLAKLARLQYPESWQISAAESSSRSQQAHGQEYRARLVDALPNVDAEGNVLETDDEGDEQALEGLSSDSEDDNGSDLDDFVAPDDEDEEDESQENRQQRSWKSMMEHAACDDGEFGAGSSESSESDGNSSGSESESEDAEDPVASEVAQAEPVDEELDGIDPSLIVSGSRQRRPPTRFVPAGFDALMLADDAADSEDDEEEDSQDDEEEDEDDEEEGEAQEEEEDEEQQLLQRAQHQQAGMMA